MKRAIAGVFLAVIVAVSMSLAPVILATEPVDFKNPRNLAGNFWFVKNVKGTVQYLGPVDSDMEIMVWEVKPGKKDGELVVGGKFRNLDKVHKFEENPDIEAEVKFNKEGYPRFTFFNRQGLRLTAQVTRSGDIVLSGPPGGLPDVIFKLAVSNTEVTPEKEAAPQEEAAAPAE